MDSRVGLEDGVGLLDERWVFLRERLGWFWPEEEATVGIPMRNKRVNLRSCETGLDVFLAFCVSYPRIYSNLVKSICATCTGVHRTLLTWRFVSSERGGERLEV